jgi:hypothetical protein
MRPGLKLSQHHENMFRYKSMEPNILEMGFHGRCRTSINRVQRTTRKRAPEELQPLRPISIIVKINIRLSSGDAQQKVIQIRSPYIPSTHTPILVVDRIDGGERIRDIADLRNGVDEGS